MRVAERARRWVTPRRAVEAFALGNLAFLAIDIYIAHSYNEFRNAAEWVPIVFSAVTPLWLGAAWALERRGPTGVGRALGIALGACSIAVGVAGLLLHLESSFFERRTIAALVYAAPFAGPLAYTGLGLLLVLDRMVSDDDPMWARWVLFLALGGFVGNLALSLADHAQDGFFDPREWVPVGAAAFAVAFLVTLVLRPGDVVLRRVTVWVIGAQIPIGVLGVLLHVGADVRGPMGTVGENLVYGAPPFAPLLSADMAVLAFLGMWALARTTPRAEAAPVLAPGASPEAQP